MNAQSLYNRVDKFLVDRTPLKEGHVSVYEIHGGEYLLIVDTPEVYTETLIGRSQCEACRFAKLGAYYIAREQEGFPS